MRAKSVHAQVSFKSNSAGTFSALLVACVLFCIRIIGRGGWRFFVVQRRYFDRAPLFGECRMNILVENWINLYRQFEVEHCALADALLDR